MKCDVFSSTINGTTMKLHTLVKHQKLRTPSNLDNSGMHFDQVMPLLNQTIVYVAAPGGVEHGERRGLDGSPQPVPLRRALPRQADHRTRPHQHEHQHTHCEYRWLE